MVEKEVKRSISTRVSEEDRGRIQQRFSEYDVETFSDYLLKLIKLDLNNVNLSSTIEELNDVIQEKNLVIVGHEQKIVEVTDSITSICTQLSVKEEESKSSQKLHFKNNALLVQKNELEGEIICLKEDLSGNQQDLDKLRESSREALNQLNYPSLGEFFFCFIRMIRTCIKGRPVSK